MNIPRWRVTIWGAEIEVLVNITKWRTPPLSVHCTTDVHSLGLSSIDVLKTLEHLCKKKRKEDWCWYLTIHIAGVCYLLQKAIWTLQNSKKNYPVLRRLNHLLFSTSSFDWLFHQYTVVSLFNKLMFLCARWGLFDAKIHQFSTQAGMKIFFFQKTLNFPQSGTCLNFISYVHSCQKS